MIDDDGAKLLAEGLKSCIHIEMLELPINIIGDVGASALAVSMKFCTNLHTVNLIHNRIGEDGARAISNTINNCKLYLWGNNLCDDDIGTLSLCDRGIGDAGAVAIANILITSTYLMLVIMTLGMKVQLLSALVF